MLEGQFTEAGYKAKQHRHSPIIIPGCKGASNVFCCVVIGDAVYGTFYTDMIGAFPVIFLKGQHYYCIAYDYATSAILLNQFEILKMKLSLQL